MLTQTCCIPAEGNGNRDPKFLWTESRVGLEGAIQEEKEHEADDSDLLSQELRLQQRLARLNLEIDVMDGDGNCLVRCLSHAYHTPCASLQHKNLSGE